MIIQLHNVDHTPINQQLYVGQTLALEMPNGDLHIIGDKWLPQLLINNRIPDVTPISRLPIVVVPDQPQQ